MGRLRHARTYDSDERGIAYGARAPRSRSATRRVSGAFGLDHVPGHEQPGHAIDRSAAVGDRPVVVLGGDPGIVQYYLLAGDVWRLNRLQWVMETSLLKTLAGKYDSSVSKMSRKYRATIETPHGPHKCLQVGIERGESRTSLVATFGGIPLKWQKHTVLHDREPVPVTARRKELIHRLVAGRCEICGHAGEVRVHQIRKLADLDKPRQPQQPEWMQIMARRRRKTLVVCASCHAHIHHGRPTASTTGWSLESPVIGNGRAGFGRGSEETEPPATRRLHPPDRW